MNYNIEDLLKENKQANQTNQNVEEIENLFNEQDKNEQEYNNIIGLNYEDSASKFPSQSEEFNPLEQTKDLSEIDLEKLKQLSNELHAIYDEKPSQEEKSEGASKGNAKVLTKATKEGKAMAKNEIADAFINYVILCFTTALIGGGWFLYLINHLN